jgi:hypothetical protein
MRYVRLERHIPMRNPTVKINLVGQTHLRKNSLAFMALLSREDGVRLCGSDGQRALDTAQLFRAHKARVCNIPNIDLTGVWTQVSHDVFCAEAVANCADILYE